MGWSSRVLVFSVILGVTASAGIAFAAYNTPAKAKKLKVDLTVAYDCTAPNATAFFAGAGILVACSPPVPVTNTNPANVTTFGIKGAANVQVGVATGDLKVGVKALDVLNNGMPANVSLGMSAARVLTTSGTCAPGLPPQPAPVPGTECTSTDIASLFSGLFAVPCVAGKCQLKTSVNTLVPGAITAGGKIVTEIGGISIDDPDGDRAFTQGLLIP
jgi:hypothetical protein